MLYNMINDHLSDELDNAQFDQFIKLCSLIKPIVLYESDTYTLRRVIVGFDKCANHNSCYNLNNITKGIVTCGQKEYQSWTMNKSTSWILRDRYESIAKEDGSTIMYMIEKTFHRESILMHIPSLVCALRQLGFEYLYDGFFDKRGLHSEDEVIVNTSSEIEYENIWFFTMCGKSHKKILYKKTSEDIKIPLVEGGYSKTGIIYF